MADQNGQDGQQREMTEEEKQALVNRIFEDRPMPRKWAKLHRLDAQLSVNDGPDIPPDRTW